MKVQITNQQQAEGIIIIDIGMRTSLGDVTGQLDFPTAVGKLDFKFVDSSVTIIDIGTTSLTPTVNTNVKTLTFDPDTETLKVLDANDDSVLTVSTNNRTVLARVNFATSTITIYE